MKKILFATSFTLLFSLVSVAAFAQEADPGTKSHPVPKWVPENGYWIVETNIRTPKLNTIYFYNNDHVLVYKERLDGIVLKVNKRRVKMNLKKVLEQSVTAYNEKQKAAEDQMLVKNLINKN